MIDSLWIAFVLMLIASLIGWIGVQICCEIDMRNNAVGELAEEAIRRFSMYPTALSTCMGNDVAETALRRFSMYPKCLPGKGELHDTTAVRRFSMFPAHFSELPGNSKEGKRKFSSQSVLMTKSVRIHPDNININEGLDSVNGSGNEINTEENGPTRETLTSSLASTSTSFSQGEKKEDAGTGVTVTTQHVTTATPVVVPPYPIESHSRHTAYPYPVAQAPYPTGAPTHPMPGGAGYPPVGLIPAGPSGMTPYPPPAGAAPHMAQPPSYYEAVGQPNAAPPNISAPIMEKHPPYNPNY